MKKILTQSKAPKLLIVILAFLFFSCNEDDNSSEPPVATADETPDYLIEIFERFDVIEIEKDEVIGINGITATEFEEYLIEKYGANRMAAAPSLTPNEQLAKLTYQLVEKQRPYTIRDNYRTDNQPNGLAYVYGGKTHNIHAPHSASVCKEHLAGFDCSGLLYQGAIQSGVNKTLDGNAVAQSKKENWNSWLSQSEYKDIEASYEEFTSWNAANWKTGDIIVFDHGSHIGTIAQLNGRLAIVHSQGKPSYTCAQNKGERTGPKVMTSDDVNNWKAFTINQKHLARIRFGLKNNYNLQMQCIGNAPLYTINLSIDINKTGSFEDELYFRDYDGSNSRQKFTYSYNPQTQVFSFTSIMTDDITPGTRTDTFSIAMDALGSAIPSTVSFAGGMAGCNAEFILKSGLPESQGRASLAGNTKVNCALTN